MSDKKCVYCGCSISTERLDYNPNIRTCVSCADIDTPQVHAFMEYGHKTAGSIVLVDKRNSEAMRMADRAYRRRR